MSIKERVEDGRTRLMGKLVEHHETTPVYVPGPKTEKEIEALAARLKDRFPLVYIWNQRHTRDGLAYSVSVHSAAVGTVLETLIKREDRAFEAIRDSVMDDLRQASLQSINEICQTLGKLPSACFRTLKT